MYSRQSAGQHHDNQLVLCSHLLNVPQLTISTGGVG